MAQKTSPRKQVIVKIFEGDLNLAKVIKVVHRPICQITLVKNLYLFLKNNLRGQYPKIFPKD